MREWRVERWDERSRPERTRGTRAAPTSGAGRSDASPVDAPVSRRAMLGALVAGGAAIAGGGWFLENLATGRNDSAGAAGSRAASSATGLEQTWVPGAAPNPVPAENARAGTGAWLIPGDPQAEALDDGIKGFASSTGVAQGQAFDLFVSTDAPRFDVEVYRLGWYGSDGARLVTRREGLTGIRQPEPTVGEGPAYTVEAPWEPVVSLRTDGDWVSGIYLVKLVASDGSRNHVPLVVRDDRPAALLYQASVTTWLAYNVWGGKSVYRDTGAAGRDGRSRVTSFQRPVNGNGAWKFLWFEAQMVRFLERHGFDVTYATNIETHTSPELLVDHAGILSVGHDEYWSLEMRDHLEAARDAGVNLAFLGANAGYRKIRFEDSPHGPHRRVAHYKEYTEDPLLGVRDELVAAQWRHGPTFRPENELIGIMYVANPVDAPWRVEATDHWLFEETGFRSGDAIPHLVGHEYDRAFFEGGFARTTPDNLRVLSRSPVTVGGDHLEQGKRDEAHTSLYYAPSGAGVFAAGTNRWSWGLDGFGDWESGHGTDDGRLRRLTENLLDAMSAGPMQGDRSAARAADERRRARRETIT